MQSTDIYSLIIERYPELTVGKKSFFVKTWEKYLGQEWTFPIEVSKRPDFPKKKS